MAKKLGPRQFMKTKFLVEFTGEQVDFIEKAMESYLGELSAYEDEAELNSEIDKASDELTLAEYVESSIHTQFGKSVIIGQTMKESLTVGASYFEEGNEND